MPHQEAGQEPQEGVQLRPSGPSSDGGGALDLEDLLPSRRARLEEVCQPRLQQLHHPLPDIVADTMIMRPVVPQSQR